MLMVLTSDYNDRDDGDDHHDDHGDDDDDDHDDDDDDADADANADTDADADEEDQEEEEEAVEEEEEDLVLALFKVLASLPSTIQALHFQKKCRGLQNYRLRALFTERHIDGLVEEGKGRLAAGAAFLCRSFPVYYTAPYKPSRMRVLPIFTSLVTFADDCLASSVLCRDEKKDITLRALCIRLSSILGLDIGM